MLSTRRACTFSASTLAAAIFASSSSVGFFLVFFTAPAPDNSAFSSSRARATAFASSMKNACEASALNAT